MLTGFYRSCFNGKAVSCAYKWNWHLLHGILNLNTSLHPGFLYSTRLCHLFPSLNCVVFLLFLPPQLSLSSAALVLRGNGRSNVIVLLNSKEEKGGWAFKNLTLGVTWLRKRRRNRVISGFCRIRISQWQTMTSNAQLGKRISNLKLNNDRLVEFHYNLPCSCWI